MGLGVALFLVTAAHAGCPPLADALEAATTALIDGVDTGAAFTAAEASLACAPATKTELARLFLLRGAALQLAGEADAVGPFYAAAIGQDATYFDDRLGPAVRAAWTDARHGDPGRLTANRPLDVDGTRVDAFPATLESGPHALQALEAGWARVVVLPAGEELAVEVPTTRPVEPPTRKKSALWLVAGGAALAGAVGCGAGAMAQTETMGEAETVAALDEAWTTQTVLGSAALGLAALGGTGVVLHFVLP